MTYFAQASFPLKDAQAVIDAVCEHLVDHGVSSVTEGGQTTMTSPHGRCEVDIVGDQVVLKATAQTLTGLGVIREEVAGHMIEHSADLADKIIWSGDGSDQVYPAWFCQLTVVGTSRVTPHMQRIKFTGSNLARYAGFDNIHVRLMFPSDSAAPQWPGVNQSGVATYPDDDILAIRRYTVRTIDPVAEWMEVDFVLHDIAGPGSDFARRAVPGDVIGMGGPGGLSVPPDRDWYLLAGDETALPAMARILETLPAGARGVALIEVESSSEQQPIANRSGIEVRWLHRNGAAAGTVPLLLDAVRGLDFPTEGVPSFFWVGCEHQVAMSIKSHLRKDRGIDKRDDLVVSYWRIA